MPTAALSRDVIREEIITLMEEKDASVAGIVASTHLSRNGIYEYLAGKRSMHADNATLILLYLRKLKKRK